MIHPAIFGPLGACFSLLNSWFTRKQNAMWPLVDVGTERSRNKLGTFLAHSSSSSDLVSLHSSFSKITFSNHRVYHRVVNSNNAFVLQRVQLKFPLLLKLRALEMLFFRSYFTTKDKWVLSLSQINNCNESIVSQRKWFFAGPKGNGLPTDCTQLGNLFSATSDQRWVQFDRGRLWSNVRFGTSSFYSLVTKIRQNKKGFPLKNHLLLCPWKRLKELNSPFNCHWPP